MNAFISYANCDKPFVKRLRHALDEKHIATWAPESSLHPGDDFVQKIEDAVANADAVLIVISPGATKSDWVSKEWAIARARTINEGKPRIIPVLAQRTEDLPYFLKTLHWVDMTDPSHFDSAVDLITEAILRHERFSTSPKTTTSTTTSAAPVLMAHVNQIGAEHELLQSEMESFSATQSSWDLTLLKSAMALGLLTLLAVAFTF